MNCIRKHKITVKIDWRSLESDVQGKVYKAGKQLGADAEDAALLRRAMTDGVAEVVAMCGKYMWSKQHQSDNYLLDDDTVTITLMMPMNFNLAGCASLGRMMHSYITAKAMTEWSKFFKPDMAEMHQAQQANARAEITRLLGSRVKMMRNVNEMVISVGKVNNA